MKMVIVRQFLSIYRELQSYVHHLQRVSAQKNKVDLSVFYMTWENAPRSFREDFRAGQLLIIRRQVPLSVQRERLSGRPAALRDIIVDYRTMAINEMTPSRIQHCVGVLKKRMPEQFHVMSARYRLIQSHRLWHLGKML